MVSEKCFTAIYALKFNIIRPEIDRRLSEGDKGDLLVGITILFTLKETVHLRKIRIFLISFK